MKKEKLEDTYNLLSKNYRFKRLSKKNAAKFSNYNDAFSAALDAANSNLGITAGQNNKVVYFSDRIEKPCVEARESDGELTYEGLIMSFSMHLNWFVKLDFKKIVRKNKLIINGNIDPIFKEFKRICPNYSKVARVRKNKSLIIERI